MSYATLANLEPQFGLYSSFMGVIVYWFFATSKDITIGVSNFLSLSFELLNCFLSVADVCANIARGRYVPACW